MSASVGYPDASPPDRPFHTAAPHASETKQLGAYCTSHPGDTRGATAFDDSEPDALEPSQLYGGEGKEEMQDRELVGLPCA